ncbi:Hsp70 family protein [Phormidium sp. CCY1219]|uniref:Hsp70 family protein n=1 Tax=Phormidium sp. CCY1219 TaxID=2886104 RepID=UPI002D1F1E0A|nr:Hsp70 family protein [Phormidium sp. CCY1219]MEB3827727.1 Hsp70 family protein [Phormidium sp. CCY1219]
MTTLAIDFGTSNTVVSILNPDRNTPETLRFREISRIFKMKKRNGESREIPVIPSQVFVKPGNHLIVGQQVISTRLGLAQPDRLFQGFKRDLAADFQPPPRVLDGYSYSAPTISQQFIGEIWQRLARAHVQPSRVVFAVPVGAFERYLDWFREMGDKLGVPEINIVDESTAAALGYAVNQPGTVVLVVDFGGGTLDLSLVRTALGSGENKVLQAEVLAKSDAYVGGIDIDIWIVEEYLQQIGLSKAQVGSVGWQNLLEIAERLKMKLSRQQEAKESWFDDENFMSHEVVLSREGLEEILEKRLLLEQLRQALDEVVAIALGKGISKSDIEQVLLVGGSCLIPAVQSLILSYFGRSRVKMDKPFEAVAHGALALRDYVKVEDYLHHSYAIRLWDPAQARHFYYPLFEKGIKYPTARAEPLILKVAIEGQREIRLDIGEVGEISQAEVMYDEYGRMTSTQVQTQEQFRALNRDRSSVCVARLNPPGQLGVDRIAVQFEVNAQRVLLATVRDVLTGETLVDAGAIAKLQ